MKTIPEGIPKALSAAVSALYFADNSDYETALWNVVDALSPEMAELLESNERKAWEAAQEMIGAPTE